ncbi:MAG: TonB family protein [Bacteroidales bacterium]|nr:TonB family protein [Bacteroidales bacterium]
MTPFLLYIGRSSLYLALFYAFFLLVMRRTTFFRLNRILLLVGTVACFLLPLLRLRTVEVPLLMVGSLTEAASEPALTAGPSASSPFPYLELLYILGFLAVLAWTAVAMVRMYRTIRKGATTRLEDGTRLVLTEADVPSFSWGRTIVMSRKDAEVNPVIRLHEEAHIRKAHTLDILLFTAVTLVHWFNPLVWITLSELKLLHEYEADDAVLNHGIDATQYQLLLVRKAVGDKRFTLANGFQHAKLKNRIDMMLQAPSSGWKRLSWLAILPFLAGTMFLCNPVRAKVVSADQPETVLSETALTTLPDTTKVIPFATVEVKPMFNGGDAIEFSKWVNENLKYPQAAKDAGVQGRVTLQFTVYPDGSVRDTKVLRGVNPDLDAEALRVVSASPNWTPGYVKGEPVKVTYTFPVIFKLSGEKTEPKTASIHVTGEANEVFIRGALADSVLFVLDGKPVNRKDVNLETIESIQVLKDEKAIEKYGEKARYGVVEFTSKKQQ